jgi:hypothetical protein
MGKIGRGRNLCVSIILCCLISTGIFSTGQTSSELRPAVSRAGFLIDLAVQNGYTQLQGGAEIDNYLENRHLNSEDDWFLFFLNSAKNNIGARRISNPVRLSPILTANQRFPFTIKVPSIAGLASVAIFNQYMEQQIVIPIDKAFKDAAAANRRAFLESDREMSVRAENENQQKPQLYPERVKRIAAESGFAELPEELQEKIRSDFAREISEPTQSEKRTVVVPQSMLTESVQGGATTILVSGTVLGANALPLSGVTIMIRQLAVTTPAAPYYSINTNYLGKYSILIPSNLQPGSFVAAAYRSDYLLQVAGLEIAGDTTCNFQMIKGITMSGSVVDTNSAVVRGARIRVYQNGSFINSTLSVSSTSGGVVGSYAIDLAPGKYDLEILPPSSSLYPTLASLTMKDVSVLAPCTVNSILPRAEGILNVKLYYDSQQSYNRFGSLLMRFELYQSGITKYAMHGILQKSELDASNGRYYRSYNIYVTNGKYNMVVLIGGCRPISVSTITVSGATPISVDVPAPILWNGVLRTAEGTPIPNTTIQSYSDLAKECDVVTTSSSGKFSILLTPNGFVKFFTDQASGSILHTERIGDIHESRNEDVILDKFPSFADSGAVLTQIYGVPDRNTRWNIVMIGDGYTDIHETYTDLNRNGKWDGIIWYDLNNDGVWNTGELYQRYGTAAYPVNGENPNSKSEPFIDLNGDGVPNLRDQQLFDQNTMDTARSLLGQDVWEKHRDIFNIYRIRLVSRQAGHTILDESGNVVVKRDTALGTTLDTPSRGYMFNANNLIISQYINKYVPECDTRIVVVNQPVKMGRVNSYMFQYGGDISTLCNDYTVAHEMGHNIGLLADEYFEYEGNYIGPESTLHNVTSISDPKLVPWRSFFTPGKEIPSLPGSRGVGLYEGAYYYPSGKYRPTEYCMMVSGNRYCPVCTSEIEVRLNQISQTVPSAVPISPSGDVSQYPVFTWKPLAGVSHSLLEIQTADGKTTVASYDIYDNVFALQFALSDNTGYRWQITPSSSGKAGQPSAWIQFLAHSTAFNYSGVIAQVAAGGVYETELIGLNTGTAPANVVLSIAQSDGSPLINPVITPGTGWYFNINSMGATHIQLTNPGEAISGYARLFSDVPVRGAALFKAMSGDLVLSEASVGYSRPATRFRIYLDYKDSAISGYAIANPGSGKANITLILRDDGGNIKGQTTINLAAGCHLVEFADQRFPGLAIPGFLGSLEVQSDQSVGVIALRYDNPLTTSQVFSTIPVLLDEASSTLYMPQLADGNGYRSHILLLNPQGNTASLAKIEFFKNDGTPQSIPIEGQLLTSLEVDIKPNGVARIVTDGVSPESNVAWVKVTSTVPIYGSTIFQTIDQGRIISEAGVSSSPLMLHFIAYATSLGSTGSGLAICNPNAKEATLEVKLRRATGAIAAKTSLSLAPGSHFAKFFTEWFPDGFEEFDGPIEFISNVPVSAVALRYDNPGWNVFATIPVFEIP